MTRTTATNRPAGFTLIELMVVAAIIAVLLSVTMPAIKSLMDSSQQAQAENMVRANLMSARSYAMTNAVLAGLRFQDDGRIVQVFASNYLSACNPESFRTKPVYQMRAIEGAQPDVLPGNYRVIADGYSLSSMDLSTGNWWVNERWYATCAVLFSPRGRCIQARCLFPAGSNGWYPATSGDFGRWTYDLGGNSGTIYDFQGSTGIHGWNPASLDVVPATGPNVTTEFRIYDALEVRSLLKSGQMFQDGYTDYQGDQAYSINQSISEAKSTINSTAVDFIIDVNSGMMIRRNATVDSDVN